MPCGLQQRLRVQAGHIRPVALSFVVDFHRDDTVLEFLAVRRILEPAATAMAAARIDEERLDALAEGLDRLGDDPSVEELVPSDLEFHRAVVACAGNSVLCSLLDGLPGPTARARIRRGLTQEDAVRRTLYEHRAILAALRDRDAETARSWATVRIASVEQWLRSAL